MTGHTPLPLERRYQFACDLAGALAETGVRELSLRRSGKVEVLATRTTDLPAKLADGELELIAAGLRVEFMGLAVEWDVQDDRLDQAIRAASG